MAAELRELDVLDRPVRSVATDDWRQRFLSTCSFRAPDQVVDSAWHQHAPFAFWLIDKLKPRFLVELGAHRGFSYFAMCQGVRMAGGSAAAFAIDHWSGDDHAGRYGEDVFAGVARYNAQHYSDFSTLMRMSFADARRYFDDGSIDLLHIDGRHYHDDVKSDFETWLPKLSDRAVVLFHDTNVRERGFGVQRYWAALSQRYPSFAFVHGHGLGVLGVGKVLPPAVRDLLDVSADEASASAIKSAYARLGAAVSADHRTSEAREAATAAMRGEIDQAATALAEGRRRAAEISARMAVLEAQRTASQARHMDERARQERTIARLTMELREARRAQRELVDDRQSLKRSWLFRANGVSLVVRRGLAAVARRWRHGRIEPLFDARWYLHKNPDVARAAVDPFGHYLSCGAVERRDPHPLFDTAWYLASNPDVAASDINPLVHYARHGGLEGRSPHPLIEARWYLQQYPDVSERGLSPLAHYLIDRADNSCDPHPLFDTSWYLATNPDVAASGVNPLIHFVEHGARELRKPHPLFDCRWYVEQYPDVLREGVNPLVHYLSHGAGEGRNPSPMFDTNRYRSRYLGSDPINPLVHYALIGASKGLSPSSPH
ncbi:hypothetical protein FQU96_28185 [Reyranella sp. CPCC 100927]|nr:hypothetical protein FQU96_28185 [Reyranella sp. CPCC 100927]